MIFRHKAVPDRGSAVRRGSPGTRRVGAVCWTEGVPGDTEAWGRPTLAWVTLRTAVIPVARSGDLATTRRLQRFVDETDTTHDSQLTRKDRRTCIV